MTTLAAQQMKDFAAEWDAAYPTAVFSGIVGDADHAARGGYHISIEDQSSLNYSVVRIDDKAPPGTWPRNLASAIDMSMATSDMVKQYNRVWRVFNNPNDPRRQFFNAFNGWDGSGDAIRLDFVSGKIGYASPDHKWHNHAEWRRRYVLDGLSYHAARSMFLTDEDIPAYLARIGQTPAPKPPVGSQPGTRDLYVTEPNLGGPDVEYVQKFIGSRRCGTADGWYGPNTANGVRWYQGMRGLQVDGIVGPVTWSHLLGRTVRY